ncbi:PilZ domain-containing protein [Sphingomonas sp.]|uniref:PilZ domain-containing protein n=1 Tax=Sphingomonas sp. TaxID=28214 RepID=UPI0017A3D128|nr:PilZ domain-containing protein [Sphingomonas sp.]MBA3510559.1 PilZ domain-containing protein [Sphingomonas sp.]
MGIESTPNEFRATLRSERSDPVVAEKPKRTAGKAAGLGDIKVARSESRSSNQRNGDRHRLSDEQAVVQRKGKRHVVELINLSHGGAMVAGDFKAKLWDKVVLVLGEAGEIECAVRWIRDGRYGLEFAHETQVQCDRETLDELLRQVIRNSFPGVEVKAPVRPAVEKPEDKRGEVRHPLIWSGIVHHDYEWDAVRLRNISTTGALIECPSNLPTGVMVYLELGEAGKLAATVNWSLGDQAGLSFHEPFDVRSLWKLKPDVAAEQAPRPHFAPYGRECDQSPWAPQWGRLSVDELGKELGG